MLTRIRLIVALARRNVFRNRKRSFLTLLAIAVGIWSSIGLSALARGMGTEMIESAIHTLTGHAQIHAPGYLSDPVVHNSMSGVPEAQLQVLESSAVTHWTTRVRVPAVVMSERESIGVTLVGIEPARERLQSFIGEAITKGRYLESVSDKGLIIGEALAETLQTGLGKRVVLMSERTEPGIADRGFRVVGVYRARLESTEKSYVFTGRAVAQQQLKLGEAVSEVSLRVEDGSLDAVVSQLRAAAPETDVQPWMTLEPLISAFVGIQDGFLWLWDVIVVIAIGFGLVNTMFMAVFERTREFGLFQALGMKPPFILWQVLLESFFLLLAGAVLGNILGFGTVALLSDGINLAAFADGLEIAGMGKVVYPALTGSDVVISNLTILVLALLSSIYPAWRASRLKPVEALAKI